MKELRINPHDKILIIAPHPDDESIGCGGLLLKYGRQSDVICLTDGRQGQGDITPKKLSTIRKYEFETAMQQLKVNNYRMLDIEDGTLCAHLFCLNEIDLSSYSKIFVTGKTDKHPDHSAALVLLRNACKLQEINKPNVYEYEVHYELEDATHYIQIDDIVEAKRNIIRIYDSQIKNTHFDNKIIDMNLKNGEGKHYIEQYKKIELNNIDTDLSLETDLEKSRELYWIFVRWMRLNQRVKSISLYLKKNYSSIIIYGYKELGQILEKELAVSDINIESIIDNNPKFQKSMLGKSIIRMSDLSGEEDSKTCVLVTATFSYDAIKKNLSETGYKNVLSIKNILEELEYESTN